MAREPQDVPQYDFMSKLNHWVIAFAIIGMLFFGFYLFNFVPSGPAKGSMIGLHKAIGLAIFLYGLWRVGYRLVQGFPEAAAPMPHWQAFVARAVHIVLLCAVVLMPLSGMTGNFFGGRTLDFFGLFTIPGGPEIKAVSNLAYNVHVTIAWILVFTVALHVLAALKHHLIDHDATLRRMTGRA